MTHNELKMYSDIGRIAEALENANLIAIEKNRLKDLEIKLTSSYSIGALASTRLEKDKMIKAILRFTDEEEI